MKKYYIKILFVVETVLNSSKSSLLEAKTQILPDHAGGREGGGLCMPEPLLPMSIQTKSV